MKKKGFTLIELLAVIVILAIIALIATPMIMDVIEKARKSAAIDSVNGLLESAEQYQYESMLDGIVPNKTIDLTSNLLKHKGSKPESGTLIIGEDNKMYIIAKYGKYCIEKKFEEESPKVVDKEECTIDDVVIETPKVYGIKRAIESESSAWERTEDSIGLVANAQVGTTSVQNDFDNIYPWSDIKSYNYNTDTKTITAWYGDSNFSFDPEGNVEVLTYIPEFYYRRYQENGYEYITITKEYQEGYTKSEAFSVGRYTISGDATRVHSKSGEQPLVNTTITEFREYARTLGSEFGQLDYHYFILQLLYLVEYADYNSQAKLGAGYTNASHTEPTASGGCDILGMHSGSVDGTDDSSVIYRGIEDIFGNIYQSVDGINIKDNQVYICYDKNEYESDKFDGCYQQLGYMNVDKNGYISKLGYDSMNSLIALPTEVSEVDNVYVGDYYWLTSGNNGVTFVGGMWHDTTVGGLYDWSYTSTSTKISYYGARLLKIN